MMNGYVGLPFEKDGRGGATAALRVPGFHGLRGKCEIRVDRRESGDGVTVRRKGYWFWMDGSRPTYRNRQALRTAGARWDKNRRAWYWRPEFAKAATAEA